MPLEVPLEWKEVVFVSLKKARGIWGSIRLHMLPHFSILALQAVGTNFLSSAAPPPSQPQEQKVALNKKHLMRTKWTLWDLALVTSYLTSICESGSSYHTCIELVPQP